MILDVSNTNPIDRATLGELGPEALYCKATEGTWFKDATYGGHRQLAKAEGVPFGGYLFLHPRSPGNEAQYFLTYAKPRAGDLQPVIDAEVRDAATFAQVAARVDSCAKVLEGAGFKPLLYSYTSFLQNLLTAVPDLSRLRVWQAAYTMSRPKVGQGASVVLWQFTDHLNGYDASKRFVPLTDLVI